MYSSRFNKHLCSLLITAILFCSGLAMADDTTLQLKIGKKKVEAEVASSTAARDYGLMHRKSLPVDHGMLFVFPTQQSYCMWMRNTLIPLSVAFIDQQGIIVNIANMKPGSDDYYCATRPVIYALEMNLGWFQKNEILPGTPIRGLDKAPPGR